jgi:hypothetical protein
MGGTAAQAGGGRLPANVTTAPYRLARAADRLARMRSLRSSAQTSHSSAPASWPMMLVGMPGRLPQLRQSTPAGVVARAGGAERAIVLKVSTCSPSVTAPGPHACGP